MRNIYLLLMAFVCGQIANAQTTVFFEDFEDNSLDGYTLYNLDGLTPDDPDLDNMADSAWTLKVITSQGWTFNLSAFSVSWYVNDAGPSDDWLVTPAINIGTGAVLSWDALAITSSGNFRDQYQVFISPGNSLENLSDDATLVFDTGLDGEEATPQNRTVDLAALGFENQVIYIAFRNFTQPFTGSGTGGNELAIDNIQVNTVLSVREPELAKTIKAYPNPALGNAQLDFSLRATSLVRLDIVDITGKVLRSENRGIFAEGSHQISIRRESLPAGVYMVRISSDEASSLVRVIFQ